MNVGGALAPRLAANLFWFGVRRFLFSEEYSRDFSTLGVGRLLYSGE